MPFDKKTRRHSLWAGIRRHALYARRQAALSLSHSMEFALFCFIHPMRKRRKISSKTPKNDSHVFFGASSPQKEGGQSDKRFGERPVRTWKMAVLQKFLQLLKFFASDGQINRWLIMEGLRRMDTCTSGAIRSKVVQSFEQPRQLWQRAGSCPLVCEGILLMSFRHEQEFVAHTLQSGARKLIIGCTV